MLRRLILLALIASAALAQAPNKLFDQIGPILEGLSQISGWKVERKVPAEILHQSDFRKMMQTHMNDSGNKEVHAYEVTLKMFGMVPPDFNLVGETVDLLSEQAAAFYDYNKKKLFILDTTLKGTKENEDEAQEALVHELGHALADQHHSLGKYMKEGSPDDDASTARQAVMEGQATWLTWAYLFWSRTGKGEIPADKLDELANSAGAEDAPVYSKAPLYIRESLVFPYNQGLRYIDAVFHKFGRASFDEVFEHPPVSTQQILHPEMYFNKVMPSKTDSPTLDAALGKPAARRFRELAEGVLGEFDVSALLRQYTEPRAGAAEASHFRGGSYRLYENKRDKHPVLTFAIDWDSPEAAQTFLSLYRQVLKGKWKKLDVTTQSATELSGTGDTGKFQVRLMGNTVQSLEGLP